jgi:hypothetical protein
MLSHLDICVSRLGEQPIGQNFAGRMVFFPWGLIGRGYVLGGPDQVDRIRRLLNREHFFLIPAVLLTALALGWQAGLMAAAVGLTVHGAAVAAIFRGGQTDRVERTLAQALAGVAAGRWRAGLWLKAGAAAALAVFGWGVAAAGALPVGIAMAAGFGLVAAIHIGAIWVTAGGR